MTGYYQSPDRKFQLFTSPGQPKWREPQLAALGAMVAQWSLSGAEAPLVSVPTGVGKTAIALAAPFIAGSTRVLVVVPTRELRRQTVAQFRSQTVLRTIGALADTDTSPAVFEATGRPKAWNDLSDSDVVVGLPASISPAQLQDNPPPPDFFDLVIVDEAHHAPASTWASILEHFKCRHLLLTATPKRRDRKRLPGKLVYYYPVRQALDSKLYQPVDARILPVIPGSTKNEIDQQIADEVVSVLARPEHRTSQLLIRASNKARAGVLSALYASLGVDLPVLHSGLSPKRQREVIEGLRDGSQRGLAMVGMLVEGFDLPSLRIAGYHDKHKSLEPTAQLIGRLARVDPSHPQASVLVTARDVDVYPELEGAVRELYAEDSDWAAVLPGVIDAHVEGDLLNVEYARSFGMGSGIVDPAHLWPLRRAELYEVVAPGWLPAFGSGAIPSDVAVGERFAGQLVLYAGVSPDGRTLVVVTGATLRPRWNAGEELDSANYDLHVVSFRQAPRSGLNDLLLVNSSRVAARNALLEAIGASGRTAPAQPPRLQGAFDSLERLSVSSVGVRSTSGPTRGLPSYRMFAGSGIEAGLRDSDTAQAALGHAMIQVASDRGAFTAGVSTGKSKYWETRYTPLRQYEDFVTELSGRYWFPVIAATGPLLPTVSRGSTLHSWPLAHVVAATVDYALTGMGWTVDGHGSLDLLELFAGVDAVALGAPPPTTLDRLTLAATMPTPSGNTLVWAGEADLLGGISDSGPPAIVRRGHASPRTLAELLTERPPTLFFLDGSTVRGRQLFEPSGVVNAVPPQLVATEAFGGVDITAETRANALSKGVGISVHEWAEQFLSRRPRRGKHRWILSNDGPGEIADYVVLETLQNGQMSVELWHAKFAGGQAPGVRVGDFEVVCSQAIKSRRWPTDHALWGHLAQRLMGNEHPPIRLVEGRRRGLEVLLGVGARWQRLGLPRAKPSVVAAIGIIQPGLSESLLSSRLGSHDNSALQIAQLLSVFRDGVFDVATAVVVCSA